MMIEGSEQRRSCLEGLRYTGAVLGSEGCPKVNV
jgi:hypothetical protein